MQIFYEFGGLLVFLAFDLLGGNALQARYVGEMCVDAGLTCDYAYNKCLHGTYLLYTIPAYIYYMGSSYTFLTSLRL